MVRIKHRYLLANILYPDSNNVANGSWKQPADDVPYTVQFRRPTPDRMDSKLLARLIRDGVSELFGDYGSGMIAGSLQIKYFSPATSTAIIRVSRDHYRMVWAALTFATHLPKPVDVSCVIQVVRVSGTIKKAEEEAIRRARLSIRRAAAIAPTTDLTLGGVGAIDDAADNDKFSNGIEDLDDDDGDDDEDDG